MQASQQNQTVVVQAPSVLVVEDEPLTRVAMGMALRDVGLIALELHDADEALRIVRAGIVPDALLTDIRMPGSIDGLRLAVYLEAMFPSMMVFITSGNTLHPASRLRFNFIPKPFDPDQAAQDIKQALMRPG